MSHIVVEELVVPAAIDAPDAADFVATVEVRNAVEAHGYGTPEMGFGADELLPRWLDQANKPTRLFGVRVDGRIVARAFHETYVDDSTTSWIAVEVLPEFRGRGIGAALTDHVEAIAAADRRSKLLVYVVSPEGAGTRLTPPTGFGSVPADNPEVRFLRSRGYMLEQVERGSRLELPLDEHDLSLRLYEAAARSGGDYAVHTWVDHTPEHWRDDLAVLLTRMSTDAPSAGLEEPEDVWTAGRLIDDEKRNESSPRTVLTAAVEHLPTGRLVGFTEVSVPAQSDRAVAQEDTLVLREHRGHRLGMLLKVANLDHLQRKRPGHPSIFTFNAEENRHMLSINEAIGFVAIGYEGGWKRMLHAGEIGHRR